eukprot:10968111-Lingulodinium_polyedra.AAC.1
MQLEPGRAPERPRAPCSGAGREEVPPGAIALQLPIAGHDRLHGGHWSRNEGAEWIITAPAAGQGPGGEPPGRGRDPLHAVDPR